MLIGKRGVGERECPSLLVSSFNEGNRSTTTPTTTTTTTTLKDTLLNYLLLHLNMTHPIHSFHFISLTTRYPLPFQLLVML
jgi:hypothetical protein